MIVFRRQFLRRVRLRNLVLITLILILLYLLRTKVPVKTLGTTELSLEPSPLKLSILSEKINVFVPRSSNKIDWHDHEQIKYDNSRVGLGEQGKAAILPPDTDKELIDKLYNENGFNGLLSDKISLNRSLRDIRHEKCRTKQYLEDLPTVSVVVPFHNEHWSTLLRTASSVLYRSPKHLIKEIFLVDDASTKEFLKSKLDEYLEENMPKVKVVRLQNRSGLITARLAGARVATADVLIFLDSHTEANINWLPPLLEPIAQDYRTVVCPFIDVVAYDTFEYRPQDDGARGAFDWEFFYKRLSILPKDRENMPEPFASPVMAGGLFAISRKWFWELGGYDPGLDIWGGEQYELSFKLWQCGGRMVDAPCSRIGHIYRQFAPFPNPGHGDFVGKNYRRVAEVWMDEYAQYLYKRRPHYLQIDPGDLTDQRAIRRRLNCRSFRWFMTQIAFDLPSKYPMVEPELLAHGRIISESSELCVEGRSGWAGKAARVAPCSNDSQQEHELTWHRDVRLVSGYCWDVPDGRAGGPVLLYKCHLGGGNQMWQYLTDTHQFRHVSGSCLDHNSSAHTLFMKPCSNAQSQKWRIEHANMSALGSMPEYQPITGPLPLDKNDMWFDSAASAATSVSIEPP